jgi:predicted amidohydrolase YtcJ
MAKQTEMLRFFGGSIVTMDGSDPVAGELVTQGNRIVWLGRQGSAPPEFRKAKSIDLKGRLLLPAFSDAHTHYLYYSRTLGNVDLLGCTSLKDALDKIRKHAKANPRGWVEGNNLDVNSWKTGWPTAADLDRIIPDRPVAIFTHDYHSLWANSKVMQIAKITRHTPDPPGGRIARDSKGNPTGIFYETADALVADHIPDPTALQDERLIRKTQSLAHKVGVAAIGDMGEADTLRVFMSLAAKDQLRLRLWKSIPLHKMDSAIATGLHSGIGNEWVKIGSVKVFTDGALGSQTAWMYDPYKGDRTNRGICRTSRKEFEDIVRRATSHGLSLCVHAIGDAAVGQAIDIMAKHRKNFPANQPPRIEHLQLLHPKDLKKLIRSKIIASMQPSHMLTDRDIADKNWGTRSRNAFVLRTLWDSGVIMAFGSDVPIEPIRPLDGIGAAVHRAKPKDRRGPWHPNQRLSVWEAVWGFTMGAAIAAGDQDQRGMLRPGYLADLVVLDRNIFTIDPRRIFDTNVDMTVVNGEIVHG